MGDPEWPYLVDCKLMLARNETEEVAAEMPLVCAICPCKEGWRIVQLCTCEECVQQTLQFIGTTTPQDDGSVTAVYEGETINFVHLIMAYNGHSDWSDLGEVGEPVVLVYPINSVLWAVSHTTEPAPFSGTVTAKLYVDGLLQTSWSGLAYANEEVEIGDGNIAGLSAEMDVMGVDYAFESIGIRKLDLKITFTGNGGQTSGYTVRYLVRIVIAENQLAIRTPFLLQEQAAFELSDCAYPHPRGVTGEYDSVSAYVSPVKHGIDEVGTYETKEEAEYVLETWGDLIRAVAETCTCTPGPIGDFWKAEGCEDGSLSHWAGGGGSSSVPYIGSSGGDHGYVYYEAEPIQDLYDHFGITVTPTLIRFPDMAEIETGWSGIVPPCWGLIFKVDTAETIGFSDYPNYDIGLGGAGYWSLVHEECAIDDEYSPFYGAAWDYDMETNEGVPANSVELADYIGSLEV